MHLVFPEAAERQAGDILLGRAQAPVTLSEGSLLSLQAYLATRFGLKGGDRPHLMKF